MMNCIINVDAGEADADNPLDLALLEQVDAINIALGGHAGDPIWSHDLARRAVDAGKRVHLHPGYPDRQGFGRQAMQISWPDLAASLSQQRAVIPTTRTCKFHGAIYNQAVVDAEFAERLIEWCHQEEIVEVVTPAHSCLAIAAAREGISVLREAFADRRYVVTEGRLTLQPRSESGAVIEEIAEAMAQSHLIINDHQVQLATGSFAKIECDTICIHGDGINAMKLAIQLRG